MRCRSFCCRWSSWFRGCTVLEGLLWGREAKEREYCSRESKKLRWLFVAVCTVRLTSIDHPQIEGAYISGLCAANFIFLVCVWSSGKRRTRRNHWICFQHITLLRNKLPQNLHRCRDVIFENFRVRMTSFYLTKLYLLSNFDRLYLCQYRSYEHTSKHRCTSFRPQKGFWTSSGCH